MIPLQSVPFLLRFSKNPFQYLFKSLALTISRLEKEQQLEIAYQIGLNVYYIVCWIPSYLVSFQEERGTKIKHMTLLMIRWNMIFLSFFRKYLLIFSKLLPQKYYHYQFLYIYIKVTKHLLL